MGASAGDGVYRPRILSVSSMHEIISGCRSCGSPNIEPFLSLGETPLANGLLSDEGLQGHEPTYPLDVAFCAECSLVQILATVRPEIVFGDDYPYYSSFSDTVLEHSRKNAERLIASRGLDGKSLVVEVGSNDGYLLQYFVKEGIPVLGIDPAPGPAKSAREKGISTMCTFFGKGLAERLRDERVTADVVIANNVLAHVADLNGFVEGVRTVLKDQGLAVIEVPYVRNLIDFCEFDTIYHEHLCYFSISALATLFKRHGLTINHIEHYPIHGGSLRLYVSPQEDVAESVFTYLQEEGDLSITELGYYQDFTSRVHDITESLVALLRDLKERGNRIAAYGAAAKGATLLNFIGAGTDLVEFVVDRNVHKQGLYMPGVHIPICSPARLLEELPDYVLLLAWNFQDEILQQQAEFRANGCKFIVPIPHPTVL
jgi:SAM-dependent methyltransferase